MYYDREARFNTNSQDLAETCAEGANNYHYEFMVSLIQENDDVYDILILYVDSPLTYQSALSSSDYLLSVACFWLMQRLAWMIA
jgi:hypothetical protein